MELVLHEKHRTRVVPATISASSLHVKPRCTLSPHNNIAGTVDDSATYTKDESPQITRRSLSLLSRSSPRLLSQCSSLASLPSLGLSFHESSSEQYLYSKGARLIEVEYQCAATLYSQGEQVLCCEQAEEVVIYSASSCSQTGLRVLSTLGIMDNISTVSVSKTPSSSGHESSVIRQGPVRSMLVMGDLLFSAHEDHKIRVWARGGTAQKDQNRIKADHKIVATIPGLWDCVKRALVPGAYVEVRRNQRKSLWIQHVDAISALAVSQSKNLLYSASWDRSVKVWRLPDFRCMESFRAHEDAVNALAVLDDDGGFLYTGCADSSIRVWAVLQSKEKKRKHMLVSTLIAHRSAVNALALSPDSSLLYSGACDKAIVVWEREAAGRHHGILMGALRGHRQAVLCLVAVGTILYSGSADKTIRVWHRLAGHLHTCLAVLEGHGSPVKSLSIPRNDPANLVQEHPPCSGGAGYTVSCAIYSASLDQEVKLWRVKLALSGALSRSCDHDDIDEDKIGSTAADSQVSDSFPTS